MSDSSSLHPLLQRQVTRCGGMPGDARALLARVSATYSELDRDRARSDHANRVMAAELETALAQLEVQNLRFRAALDNMSQGLCLFDASGRVAVCNRMFLSLYGFGQDAELFGKTLMQLLDAAPILQDSPDLDRRIVRSEHVSCADHQTLELAWPDNRTITIHRANTVDGGFLITASDITASIQASARIAYLARHDSLTDLPNRVQLRERLTEVVRNAAQDEQCAVICLDLDRFKSVNDTHGHQIGDALLVSVARRLRALLRPRDAIARLGGDEFAIVMHNIRDEREVEQFANRINRTLARSFSIKGNRLTIGSSLGIAIEQAATLDPGDALRRADIALYSAKGEGRGGWRFYTDEMHEIARARAQLEIDLRAALDRHEFIVEYQPQLDLETKRLTAVEALVRWNSPTRGLVMPSDFIPACEEIGLIDELGRIVLETAVRDACEWPGDAIVAVNLSPVQFQSGQLVGTIKRALALSGWPADRLELEVTENLMIEDTVSVLQQIREIKRLGCRISLDDFGIGYSSLSYIRQFPFDKIKIDRSFIRDIEHNNDSVAIVRAVAGLCQSLALQSVAEGVETIEQLEILHRKEIDCVQGYLICHPIGSDEVGELIASTGRATSYGKRLAVPIG